MSILLSILPGNVELTLLNPLVLVLYPRLRREAMVKGMFDALHFGHEIGEFEDFSKCLSKYFRKS